MPNIQKEVSIPANGSVENVLSGSAFEFLRRRSIISLGVTGAADGLFVTIQSGADVILEESPPMEQTSFPRIPDEMAYNFAGVAGDRLVVRIRNSTAGAIISRTLVQISEVG